MSQTLVHTPAAASEGIQRCARCGVVLIDRREEQRMEQGPSVGLWWTCNVEMFVRGGGAWSTDRKANCQKADA